MDLSLIPFEDLIDEIEKRNTAYVMATLKTVEGNLPIINTYFSENTFIDCLGMCSVLEHDIKQHYLTTEK